MNLEMVPLEIVGLKADLQTILHALRNAGCVHVDELTDSPQVSARPLALDREKLRYEEQLSFLAAQVDGLRETLKNGAGKDLVSKFTEKRQTSPEEVLTEAQRGVDGLLPKVQSLVSRREKLQAELASLPRYEATLRRLLPIIPPSAHEAGNVSVGVLASRVHIGVLDAVGREILELTSGGAEVVASDVDNATRVMLIVFPSRFIDQVESILGREDVARLRLPSELGQGPPDVVLATLHRRLTAIPVELKEIDRDLAELAGHWSGPLEGWSAGLHEEIETWQVLPRFGETDMTFVLVGWVPARDLDGLNAALRKSVGERVLAQRLPMTEEMKARAPVILQNPKPAQPFESLVKLLALPRYGHTDPTRLMALFLPIFFGMILGDVGYGALLLLLSLFMLRKLKRGVARDIMTVLAMGSGWSIVFGVLFGEAFGTLGEHWGMHALWLDRASAEDVAGLLLLSLAVGAVHITLGLVLGVWEAFREKSRNHLLERGGMLLGLVSLFFIIGSLTNYLPRDFMNPAIALMILGIVFLGASLGWLGVLMGPIEFIGLIGNVLSYLRIAAIGLASVYLAKVANDVAGMVGSVIVGVIIAVLIHALNLVLGAFSPTIHSLRLHYVEFFRKFYEGGGRPYEPFKSRSG